MKPPGREGRPWALSKARLGLEPSPSSVTAALTQPLGPGHTASHTFPEGKPGIHLRTLETWLGAAAGQRHTRGLRTEVLVGMFLSHLTGHLVAQQPQSQVAPGQQSMAAPLPHGETAPLKRAWNHSSLGRQARSAALATRRFVHKTQTGTNWSH